MKKFLYTLFCILIITIITSVYLPQKANASNPEIQKVALIKAVKDINNKWEWMFQLTTQNADGYYIRIDINKIQNGQSTKIKTVDVGQPIVLNQITVLTGSILDDKTTYIVYFTVFNGENNIPYPNSMKFYSDTTGKAVSQPIITSFTPTEGKDGDSVTIIGSGFTGARKVFINDKEMTNLSVENDNKIIATVAEGTKSGKILVNFYMNSVISQNSFNIKTDPVDVAGENDPSVVNKDIYTPLAPIGNLNQVKTTDVGTYLNIIFKIAIGLCAVLAVIMIVIGGVSYMGNESVFGKTEAKSRITAAILGLIIALGAYALLNTIDPNLLGKNGVKIDQVSAGIEEDVTEVGSGVSVNGNTVKITKGRAATCRGGIVNNTLGSGRICKDLLDKLKILKSTYPNFRITSTIRNGRAQSSCHYDGNQNSGNCADIVITNNPQQGYNKNGGGSTNSEWGNLCVAIAQIGGLNYLNEASSTTNCQKIQPYKTYKNTSGPHLHVNLVN